jgi:hypothetical protein
MSRLQIDTLKIQIGPLKLQIGIVRACFNATCTLVRDPSRRSRERPCSGRLERSPATPQESVEEASCWATDGRDASVQVALI